MVPDMNKTSDFYNLGIAPNILGILDKLGFKTPTPIQEKSIPPAIEGKDLIGIAQTGTGKTLAFGIPMIQAVIHNGRGFIVLPARELALQVADVLEKIGGSLRSRTATLIGGEPIYRQISMIKKDPHIIIGTPGRIIDHMEQRTLSLSDISILVLDEADRMLDMGFAPQLNRILKVLPRNRQTMLFSATMPQDIVKIAQAHMKLPMRVEIAPSGTTASNVTHELFFVDRRDKPRLLEKILGEYRGSVLVFLRTKFGVKRIVSEIRALGYTCAEIHSNRSLAQRKQALEGFRNGKYRILFATDIASRGIDVKGIELVLNYDLPQAPDDYVHRIGRTGRAGGVGHAISFATPDQKRDVYDIERLIRATLPLSKLPTLPPIHDVPASREEGSSYSSNRPSRYNDGKKSTSYGSNRPRFNSSRTPSSSSRFSKPTSRYSRPNNRFGSSRRPNR